MARFPRLVARLAGAFLLAVGVWAMVAPESFFDALASFDPYNQHFVQDLGAFQLGLGAVLVLAARLDGLSAALFGVGVGMAAHVVSHVLGLDLGGNPTVDIPFFAVLAGLLFAGGWVHRGSSRSSRP